MPRKLIDIELEATDRASKAIDLVADNAEALERLDPQLVIDASDRASDDLDKVMARAWPSTATPPP